MLLEEVVLNKHDLLIYSALKPGPHLKVSVKDTGYGISKENLDRIFAPYLNTKGKGEGTGLGLAVVYGIVKEYGGEIKVYSKVGKGTAFHVLFPLIEDIIEQDGLERDQLLPTGTETIMFVDDEVTIVNLNKKLLERLGYKVAGFTSAEEALSVFKWSKESYDLIVTDKTMPKMTGLELVQKIKKICSKIPVILCTGYKDKDDEKKAQEACINTIIMKPVNKQEIAETIRKVLDQNKS